MDFDDYKLICFLRGIDPNIIEASRKFIIENDYLFMGNRKMANPNESLGYAELKEITNKEQSLKVVEQSIRNCILDFDLIGRNMAKVRTKQLIKNNGNKTLNRKILKSYYLHYYDL